MHRLRHLAKPAFLLGAAVVAALVVSGCAFLKPGSLKLSQPQGIGSVRVHFELCTAGEEEFCEPNETSEEFQYLAGIAVPPGAVPPQTFTATPVNGGTPIVFKLDEEVTSELTASSVSLQKRLGEISASEKSEMEELFGGQWPPSGLQGVGYISQAVQEGKGQSREWSVDAEFGLPSPASSPYAGPFETAIAFGLRVVESALPESRPVHCLRIEAPFSPEGSDALCFGSMQKAQLGTSDLRIVSPATPAQAFVGGSGQLGFPLEYAGTATTAPTFALSATTTASGGTATVPSSSFTPGTPDPSTHQSPAATGTVSVSVPKSVKPGTYEVTLTAKAPQGGSVSQVASLEVTKPKLKFGRARLNAAKGTAILQVKVPSAGKLTISGKGVVRTKKKTSKAKTLKVKIAATGKAGALLRKTGKARLKVKATFKPSSGISVSKTKPIVLKLR